MEWVPRMTRMIWFVECEVTLQFFTIREILFAVLDKAKINALYQVEKTIIVNRQNKLTTH